MKDIPPPIAIGNSRQIAVVWLALLLLTGLEIFLASLRLQPKLLLGALLGLALIMAGLMVAFFMHLKEEQRRFGLIIMATIMVGICLLLVFLTDAWRFGASQ